MCIESSSSLYTYPTLKEVITMFNQLNEEFTLRKVEPFEMAFNLPFVIDKDNGDGTYQGHLDKDNMTISQKILSTYL